jgi:hypothetical protein
MTTGRSALKRQNAHVRAGKASWSTEELRVESARKVKRSVWNGAPVRKKAGRCREGEDDRLAGLRKSQAQGHARGQ